MSSHRSRAVYNEIACANMTLDVMPHPDRLDEIETWSTVIEGKVYAINICLTQANLSAWPDTYRRSERERAMRDMRKHLDQVAPMAGPHPACFVCGSPARFHLDGWGDCDDEPADEWRAFREWPMFRERDRWACVRHRLNARYAIHATDPIGPTLVRPLKEREHTSVPMPER